MTSRRSRLKAVTNLPVRRKAPALTSNEVSLCDNENPEKISANNSKEDGKEIVKPNNTTYQNEISNHVNDCHNSDKSQQDCVKCNGDFLSDECNLNEVLISNTNLDALVNSNDITQHYILKTGTGNVNDPPLPKGNESNKYSIDPLLTENSQMNSSNKNTETLDLQKGKPHSISGNTFYNNGVVVDDNANIDSLKDNIKYFTVLPSKNLSDSSVSTFTLSTLTPCDINDTSNVSNALSPPRNSEFEEVQIYTELVEPTDFYVNLPNFVSNEVIETSEVIIESEDSEPVLTQLVSHSEKQNEKLQTNLDNSESNMINLKNVSQNLVSKTNPKSVATYGKYGTLKNDCSKAILGDSNYAVPQDLTLENNSHDSSIRKSVTVRRKRSKCNDLTKKLADAKKEFQKKFERARPSRSTLKMIDLIFYNPATNPMESKARPEKKELSLGQGDIIQEMLAEEKVDEPESMDFNLDSQGVENKDTENLSKMPVPQVKIGLNGEIILDEKSLIIETTEAKKGREDLQNSVPVFEDRGSKISYYRGKTKKTRDWTDFETKRFYKALNTIGPDFSLMQKYFPKRSRLELKNKFKREERFNRHLIDKALNNPSEFDMTLLEKDLAVEKKAEEEEAEMRLIRKMRVKGRLKKPRHKSSVLSREIVESDDDSEESFFESNIINSKLISQCEKEKKKNEMNFIFKKLLNKESEK